MPQKPKSESAAAISTCVGKLTDSDSPLRALRSSMLRVVGERNFSAQETAHMLWDYPYSTAHTVLYAFRFMVAVPFRQSQLARMIKQHSNQ